MAYESVRQKSRLTILSSEQLLSKLTLRKPSFDYGGKALAPEQKSTIKFHGAQESSSLAWRNLARGISKLLEDRDRPKMSRSEGSMICYRKAIS